MHSILMDRDDKKKIDIVIGTRPEAIKMAPVIAELKSRGSFLVRVIATGQHTDMLRQALAYFSLSADCDLALMKQGQSLDYVTSAVLVEVGKLFDADAPDAVLVHGDTTTTFASALAAFYRGIPVGHVEAGLRSADMRHPFPEELNRVIVDRIAEWWFAPTESAMKNLVREGVLPSEIYVTGNTVVDALHAALAAKDVPKDPCLSPLSGNGRFALVTAHRRESWGAPMEAICRALADLLARDLLDRILIPMHKNPTVRETFRGMLGGDERVILCEPLDYPDFVWAMDRCRLILSDSGGVQEEATALGKPLLILRDVTERPEVLDRGSGILVGTSEARIVEEAGRLLTDADAYERIRGRCAENAFGDGNAAQRIVDALSWRLRRRAR